MVLGFRVCAALLLLAAASAARAGSVRFHALSLSLKLDHQEVHGADLKPVRETQSAKDLLAACVGAPAKTQGLFLEEVCGSLSLAGNQVLVFDTESKEMTSLGTLVLDTDFAMRTTKGGVTELRAMSLPFHTEIQCDHQADLVVSGVIDLFFEPGGNVCLSTFKAKITGTNIGAITSFLVDDGSSLAGKKPLVLFK